MLGWKGREGREDIKTWETAKAPVLQVHQLTLLVKTRIFCRGPVQYQARVFGGVLPVSPVLGPLAIVQISGQPASSEAHGICWCENVRHRQVTITATTPFPHLTSLEQMILSQAERDFEGEFSSRNGSLTAPMPRMKRPRSEEQLAQVMNPVNANQASMAVRESVAL